MAVHVPLLEAQLEARALMIYQQHPVPGERQTNHRSVSGRCTGSVLHDP